MVEFHQPVEDEARTSPLIGPGRSSQPIPQGARSRSRQRAPRLLFYVFGGLVVGGDDGNNRAVYSSNDWARHNYRTCLWSSNPPEQAKMGYIDLIP